ncbi:MAG: hypothetical protein WEC84_00780 [Candidatus Andersenbacteria bacterium]
MTAIDLIIYIVNGTVLVLVLILGIILIRNASLYNYAIGDDARQTVLKFKILKLIVAIAGLAFAAAIFNLLVL